MAKYSIKSIDRLSKVDHRLINLFSRVIKYYDHVILTGHRTEAEQNAKFAKGLTKVKWPNSKHNLVPSRAIDAAPYPIPDKWGEENVKELVKFYEFAAIVRYEAAREGLKIRWGGDWDMDKDYKDNTFDDLVHFELV